MSGNSQTMSVDDLINMIQDEDGKEKVGFSQSDQEDTSNVELFNKIAEEMNADEVLKQAQASKISGNIIADIVLEKVASNLTPVVTQAIQEKIASLLPEIVAAVVPPTVGMALEKIAIGTSSAISGNLSSSTPNQGAANDLQMKEDAHNRGNYGGKVDKYFHTAETHGATVSGGSTGEGGVGEKLTNLSGSMVHKLSADQQINKFLVDSMRERDNYLSKVASDPNVTPEIYKQAKLVADAYMEDAKNEAVMFAKQAELEAEIARYQELEKKAEAGMITPEEQQEMEMLREQLMAAMGQAQGAGAEAAPEAGAPPAGAPPAEAAPAGAMGSYGSEGETSNEEPEAGSKGDDEGSEGDEDKTAQVKTLLKQYGLK
jgi:hypothetical protein